MLKRLNILILLIISSLLICGFLPYSIENKTIKNAFSEVEIHFKDSSSKLYFNYDEVLHYYNSYDPTSDENKYDRYPSKHKVDTFKVLTLFKNYPTDINDLEFLEYIDKNGYLELIIDTALFSQLDEVFVERKATSYVNNTCMPIYRDILVFKKSRKIVGIVKICFQCNEIYFVGSKYDTSHFGVFGEFEKLKSVLSQSSKEVKEVKKPHEIKLKY
jgi:hypothetical protein